MTKKIPITKKNLGRGASQESPNQTAGEIRPSVVAAPVEHRSHPRPRLSAQLRVQLVDCLGSRDELNEPLGIASLAGALHSRLGRFGVQVDLHWEALSAVADEAVPEQDPDVLGLSMKLGSLERVQAHVDRAWRGGHDPVLVLGNLQPTFAHSEVLARWPEAICVLGEGEDALVGIVQACLDVGVTDREALLDALRSRQVANLAFMLRGELVLTPRKVVDVLALPLPDRRFVPAAVARGGIVRIEASRGCPYGACSYCAISAKYAFRGWRPLSVTRVVEDAIAISAAGGRHLYFTDEDFLGADPDRMESLAVELQRARADGALAVDASLYVNARAGSLLGGDTGGAARAEALLRALKDAGLREVFVGVESGGAAQMKRYAKRAGQDDNLRALALLRRLGIEIDVGFIMFDPQMSLEDLEANVRFLQVAGLERHDARMTKALRVQPCTGIQKVLDRRGLLTGPLNLDNLVQPFRFVDERVGQIYRVYRAWEAEAEANVYALEAGCRGELRSEQERRRRKRALGVLRALDLEVLRGCWQAAATDPRGMERAVEASVPEWRVRRQTLLAGALQGHAANRAA